MTSESKYKQRQRIQNIAIENEAFLSNIMKDYDNGIVSDPIDRRSLYEKRNDANFMRQEFEKKVYSLFGNDEDASNTFIDGFDEDDIPDFNVIYPQLAQLFKGSLVHPASALVTAKQLIDNVNSTGSINQAINSIMSDNIEKLKQLLENVYSQGIIGKENADDLTDVLNALLTFDTPGFDFNSFKASNKWAVFRKSINNDINNLLDTMSTIDPSRNSINETIEVLTNIKKEMVKSFITPTTKEQKAIDANAARQQAKKAN